MSLEKALQEHAVALAAHGAILTRVADNQDRLIAGQTAAIERIDAGKGGKAATAPKADKTPPATKTVEPAVATGVTDEQVKAAAVAWMGDKSKEQRAEASKFLGEMITHFGVGGKLTGPESKLDADQRKQAKFYIERKAAGLPVDLNAEYDFDGDVKQGAAAVEEDPLG